jgi:hypothetical protein
MQHQQTKITVQGFYVVRKCPRSLRLRTARSPSLGHMDICEMEHGAISVWKIFSADAPIVRRAAILMTRWCATTITVCPGYV